VSPILTREWNLTPALLGFLLSAGPLGMAIGAFSLSWVADVYGRRRSVLMCLGLMSAGMLLSALAPEVEVLIGLRFIAGLGVGAMASSAGPLVFEYTNRRNRSLGLGLVVLGYPLGVILGGMASSWLIGEYDWRAVFVFGGICSAALMPFVLLKLPESLDYLIERRPANALARLNRILSRLQLPAAMSLPTPTRPTGPGKASLFELFKPPLLNRTVLMAVAYFFYMTSSYFILNWATQLTTDAGFSDAQGRAVAVLINVGGVIGGIVIGLLARLSFKPVAYATMLGMGLAIMAFGVSANSLILIAICSLLCGVGVFGTALVLYAASAETFPVFVRATGIGMAISAGRVGSFVGPSAAGLLLDAGFARAAVCFILALPVLISIGFLSRVPLAPAHQAKPKPRAPAAVTQPHRIRPITDPGD
jgi:MFS family permease